ncbi:MAG TPA: SDR family oxidoreductase [Pseudomonadales bacterium]
MNMQNVKLALIGCGDIGSRLGQQCLQQGAEVYGFRRRPEQLPAGFVAAGIDVCKPQTLAVLGQTAFDYVVISLTPAAFDDESYRQTYVDGLRHVLAALDCSRLRRLLWVSSSSVYHQDDGSWVDENSATEPQRFAGRRQLQAEQLLQESLGDKAVVVRFAGIYRDGRHRWLEQLQAGTLGLPQQDYFTNRIHVADCAGVLAHLLQRDMAGKALEPVYLGVDCRPALCSEVVSWLSAQSGLPLSAQPSASQARTGNKRCSNRRLLDSGYTFVYPDYRSGLQSALAASHT